MRKIIASALQKDPAIEVVGFAANGLQAIEAVKTFSPDVMTLDIEMPEMDGLTALREIRKTNKYLPIIMFSSLTHQGAHLWNPESQAVQPSQTMCAKESLYRWC